MTALQEYKDYLIRIQRCSDKQITLQELNKELLNRNVAKSYGLSEEEIDRGFENVL
jgi:hypothetical protein